MASRRRLRVTLEERNKLRSKLQERFEGFNGIEASKVGDVIRIGNTRNGGGGVGGRGAEIQPRAVVTGRTSDDLRFTGKLLDSRGQPLKDEDGADLPAVEIWVDTWPPGTAIGDCLQQWEVGHEIPIRYHLRYDEATELDVRRPYVDDVLLSIKCGGGGGGR